MHILIKMPYHMAPDVSVEKTSVIEEEIVEDIGRHTSIEIKAIKLLISDKFDRVGVEITDWESRSDATYRSRVGSSIFNAINPILAVSLDRFAVKEEMLRLVNENLALSYEVSVTISHKDLTAMKVTLGQFRETFRKGVSNQIIERLDANITSTARESFPTVTVLAGSPCAPKVVMLDVANDIATRLSELTSLSWLSQCAEINRVEPEPKPEPKPNYASWGNF